MTQAPKTPEPTRQLTGQVADATRGNWVDLYCPPAARPYLRLSRADRPIGTWLLLIPCWWGLACAIIADSAGPQWFDLWIATASVCGAFLMRGAGCTWNDITDRHIDRSVARTRSRPLPSGQVTPAQATLWMGAQALVAFIILFSFNSTAIWLGILALVPIAIYPFAKRFTWWPQVFLGIAFNWGALLGWAAHSHALNWPALTLYCAGISWTMFYDTIYAHQDKEDDALIGVKSTARLFAEQTKSWLLGFLIAMGMLLAVTFSNLNAAIYPLFAAFLGLCAFLSHLVWQRAVLQIDTPENCLLLFRSNRNAGLILSGFLLLAILL